MRPNTIPNPLTNSEDQNHETGHSVKDNVRRKEGNLNLRRRKDGRRLTDAALDGERKASF